MRLSLAETASAPVATAVAGISSTRSPPPYSALMLFLLLLLSPSSPEAFLASGREMGRESFSSSSFSVAASVSSRS